MRRGLAFFFLIVILLNVVVAQNPIEDFENAAEKALDAKEKIEDFSEDAEKWDYLSDEWKEVFLDIKFFKNLDEGLTKINPLLFFFFGEDYYFGMTFLFLVILWSVFFSTFINMNFLFSPYSKVTSLMASFIFTTILAHLGFFNLLSEIIFKIIFYQDGFIGWFWTWFILLIMLIYIAFSYKLFRAIKKSTKENIEKDKLKKEKKEIETAAEVGRDIMEGVTE